MKGRSSRWLGVALAAAPLAIACAPDLTSPSIDLRYQIVTAGGAHSCALDVEGAAWCWGSNSAGQLGVSTRHRDRTAPVAVAGDHRFRQISAGGQHTCGVDLDGRGWCWGANDGGQLGDGTSGDRSEPTPVLLGGSFSRIAAGVNHSCATDRSGGVWCWGRNESHQLGSSRGTGTNVPVYVAGAPVASDVAIGLRHSCALGAAGAFCWGANDLYQLGGATVNSSDLPVRVSSPGLLHTITAGAGHSCAITAAREIVCWGDNHRGQLGSTAVTQLGTALRVALPAAFASVSASSSGDLTCGADAVRVWCWGGSSDDRLGPIRTVPIPIRGLSGTVASLATGARHACAIVDGRVKCWGRGESGQLGDGRRVNSDDAVGF